MTSIGYKVVEDDWMDFLDYCVTHPASYIVNFRKPIDVINDLGYSECLYYFIAMGIDSDAWLPEQFAEELAIDEGTVLDIYEAYNQPINYVEPVDAYLDSSNDFYKIWQDFWYEGLREAW